MIWKDLLSIYQKNTMKKNHGDSRKHDQKMRWLVLGGSHQMMSQVRWLELGSRIRNLTVCEMVNHWAAIRQVSDSDESSDSSWWYNTMFLLIQCYCFYLVVRSHTHTHTQIYNYWYFFIDTMKHHLYFILFDFSIYLKLRFRILTRFLLRLRALVLNEWM